MADQDNTFAGEQTVVEGATLTPVYHSSNMDVIGVPMQTLTNFRSSSREEIWQFAIAEFFIAGPAWLAFERFLTVDSVKSDLLFWACLIAMAAATIPLVSGWRQLARRRNDIDRLIENSNKNT